MRPHLIWDWNGTLFDDGHLVIDGLNAVLDHAGAPRVDVATYQRLYTRPVKVFYERLLGRAIDPEEWAGFDDRYHDGYREALHRAALTADAPTALETVRRGGGTQSLLSMWRHEELLPLVGELGIAEHFTRIDGVRGAGGGVKAPFLAAHLDRLAADLGTDATSALVIGDALDDAAAAAEVGVDCVLYDGGSHPRAELEAAGVPVASSLTEALVLAGWS